MEFTSPFVLDDLAFEQCPCLDDPPDFDIRPPPKFFFDLGMSLDDVSSCSTPNDQLWTAVQDVSLMKPVDEKSLPSPHDDLSYLFFLIAFGAAIGTLLIVALCFLLWHRHCVCNRFDDHSNDKAVQPSSNVTDIDANSLLYSVNLLPNKNLASPSNVGSATSFTAMRVTQCPLLPQRPLPRLPHQYALLQTSSRNGSVTLPCPTFDNYNMTYEEISLNKFNNYCTTGANDTQVYCCSHNYNVVAEPRQPGSVCSCGSSSIPGCCRTGDDDNCTQHYGYCTICPTNNVGRVPVFEEGQNLEEEEGRESGYCTERCHSTGGGFFLPLDGGRETFIDCDSEEKINRTIVDNSCNNQTIREMKINNANKLKIFPQKKSHVKSAYV
uniref:Uncharacterized protein n=1 Tax=Romanomermis culicivorax TaxID=13658 RepID=A0A915J590_ROMCU